MFSHHILLGIFLCYLMSRPDAASLHPKCHRCSPSWNRNPRKSCRERGQQSEHEAGEKTCRLAMKTGADLQTSADKRMATQFQSHLFSRNQ